MIDLLIQSLALDGLHYCYRYVLSILAKSNSYATV